MNHSTKETDEVEKIDEQFSHSEDIPTKRSRFNRLVKPVLITILSLLCLSGGVVLHKIHSIDEQGVFTRKYSDYSPKTSLNILKENTSAPSDNPLKTISPIKQIQKNSEIIPAPEKVEIQPEPILKEISTKPENKTTPSEFIAPATNEMAQNITNISEKNTVKLEFLDGFTLKDALEFKENFLAENQCKRDYQKLLNVPNKTNEALAVLSDLSPYCQNNQKPVQNVLNAFLKNKKEALIVYYKQNNPPWLAYLKSIPISLIEIRRIAPTKNTPKNILYKAQNELLIQHVENAVNFVTQLPLSMQQKMDDFYREAAIYNRAVQSLDQLILSFERKGE